MFLSAGARPAGAAGREGGSWDLHTGQIAGNAMPASRVTITGPASWPRVRQAYGRATYAPGGPIGSVALTATFLLDRVHVPRGGWTQVVTVTAV